MNNIVLSDPDTLPVAAARDPWPWARDGAIIAAITAFAGPAVLTGSLAFQGALIVTAIWASLGLAVGAVTPALIGFSRRRLSLGAHLVLVPVFAYWIGGLAGLLVGPYAGLYPVSAWVLGAFGAGVQVTTLFLPYLVVAMLDQPRWPVVAASLPLAAIAAWLTWWGLHTPGALQVVSVLALGATFVVFWQVVRETFRRRHRP